MKGSEWSLVLFTILVQTAVGCFITLGIAYHFFFLKNENEITHQLTSKLLFAICAILILALSVSFLHLGSPKNAIYSLRNISSSWLSREILFLGLFTGLILLFSFFYYKGFLSPQSRNIFAGTAVLSGFITIFSMSKIYMIDTVPVWNNISTPIQFYLTAFMLGAASFIAGLYFISGQMKITPSEFLQTEKIIKIIIIAVSLMLVLQIAVWLFHMLSLPGGLLAEKVSYGLVIRESALLFYSRIISAAISVAVSIYILQKFSENFPDPKLLLVSFLLVFISELIGRFLFYTMFARVGV